MATVNLSVDEFKANRNVTNIDLVRSPKTHKLFAVAGGKNYRVQGKDAKSGAGELDLAKPITFIYDDEVVEPSKDPVENGCFANGNAENLIGQII